MTTGSKAILVSLAFVLLACLTCPGNARADNFPHIKLANTSGEKVCVIGYSLAHPNGGPTDPGVPAYYLTLPGGWTPVPAAAPFPTIVGTEVTPYLVIPTAPVSPPLSLINGASLTFFYGPSDCSQIKYYIIDSNGNVNKVFTYVDPKTGTRYVRNYAYPTVLFEYTVAYDTNPTTSDHRKLIVDTSNVDNLQGLVEITVIGMPPNDPPTVTIVKLGNQVTATPLPAAVVTPLSVVVGDFSGWLDVQPKPAPPNDQQISTFKVLASASLGPFQSIQSPKDYIGAKCAQATTVPVVNPSEPAPLYPNSCTAEGGFIHLQDPLNSYYEGRISNFFSKSKNLKLMADAQGNYLQGAWLVDQINARCPIFLKAGDLTSSTDKSLHLTFTGTPAGEMIICNPASQLAFLGGPPPSVTQAAGASTATVVLTGVAALKVNSLPNRGVGYNIGQPETNWVGRITSVTASSDSPLTLNVFVTLQNMGTIDPNNPASQFQQVDCTNGCTTSNPTFSNNWYVSNVPYAALTIPYETGTQMVFNNDGVFSPYGNYYVSPLNIIYESIVRNIVQGFSHGIENCAGQTSEDPNCVDVKALPDDYYINGAQNTASAIWSVQSNWYPAKGWQNYYAQYLHTKTFSGPPGSTAFWLPSGQLNMNSNPPPYGVASSRQGTRMAMVYAFGFDENPTYLSALAAMPPSTNLAQVPSKLDPIPDTWLPLEMCGNTCGLAVTVGPRCLALPCESPGSHIRRSAR